jgi:hypothetical protein
MTNILVDRSAVGGTHVQMQRFGARAVWVRQVWVRGRGLFNVMPIGTTIAAHCRLVSGSMLVSFPCPRPSHQRAW